VIHYVLFNLQGRNTAFPDPFQRTGEGEEARIFEARQQAEILSLLVTQVESKRQILIPIAAQVEEERFRKPGLGTKRYSVQ